VPSKRTKLLLPPSLPPSHLPAPPRPVQYPGVPGLEFAPPTPNIDALALAGVRLESHYVHPLCSPSRTAFLSGRWAYTTGSNSEVIVDGVPDQLPTNYRTVADLLSANGFNTSAYGKWDLGSECGVARGADVPLPVRVGATRAERRPLQKPHAHALPQPPAAPLSPPGRPQ
jgi:arylsulfatase A-like enzyme